MNNKISPSDPSNEVQIQDGRRRRRWITLLLFLLFIGISTAIVVPSVLLTRPNKGSEQFLQTTPISTSKASSSVFQLSSTTSVSVSTITSAGTRVSTTNEILSNSTENESSTYLISSIESTLTSTYINDVVSTERTETTDVLFSTVLSTTATSTATTTVTSKQSTTAVATIITTKQSTEAVSIDVTTEVTDTSTVITTLAISDSPDTTRYTVESDSTTEDLSMTTGSVEITTELFTEYASSESDSDSSTADSTIETATSETTIPLTTTTTITTTTTVRPCIPSCSGTQVCVNGICVNTGNLAITLRWDVPGDGDLVVTTPNNKTIYHENGNASIATDYGELDVDDERGMGPESIYWNAALQSPPIGVYHVCFQQYRLNATVQSPITARVDIRIPNQATQVYTKIFTSRIDPPPNWCHPTLVTFIVSFSFP